MTYVAEVAPAASTDRLGPLLVSVGALADVQYADLDDGKSFHGVPRFYRNSLDLLSRAVDHWRAQGVTDAIHFGDILDGFQATAASCSSMDALGRVLAVFEGAGMGHKHMLGNHCLYNLDRATLNRALQIDALKGDLPASYYAYSPHPRWRVVVLDAYDVSILGWPEEHPHHQQALATLHRLNPNKSNFNSPEGLVGPARRFVKFGGGLGAGQLRWLEGELAGACDARQLVLLCCHLPLHPDTCPPACLVWNYGEVLALLRRFPTTVAATCAGHAHQNGYALDSEGVHHLVLPGVVETPPGRACHGTLDFHEHGLALRGVDTMMTVRCPVKRR